jgi:enolase
MKIAKVFAWEALDSRGTPTLGAVVTLSGGATGQALVPSGASTGRHEAHERRDGGIRYAGKGTLGAVASVNGEIAKALRGVDVADQDALDALLRELDGTPNLSRLGANAVLAVSIASALAASAALGVPFWRMLSPSEAPVLPLPMVNVLSGGAHAGQLIDVQDVLAIPTGAKSFSQAIEWAARVRAGTAQVLHDRGHSISLVADEGGLAVRLETNRAALEAVVLGIERAGLEPGAEVSIGVDIAATQLVTEEGTYSFARERRLFTAVELIAELNEWIDDFPLVSIEDPLGEDDDEGWRMASDTLGARAQLLGDDRFVTSSKRLEAAIRTRVGNAVLVKPNQVGTLSAARLFVERARQAGYATVLSARSGETEETWLADLAIGWRTGQLKVGSTTRSERTAKWNRLLRIESEEPNAIFAGNTIALRDGLPRGWDADARDCR